MKTCNTCFYWYDVGADKFHPNLGSCYKMRDCICCHEDKQTAGAIGGGSFRSLGIFGCVMWRVDSRVKNGQKKIP